MIGRLHWKDDLFLGCSLATEASFVDVPIDIFLELIGGLQGSGECWKYSVDNHPVQNPFSPTLVPASSCQFCDTQTSMGQKEVPKTPLFGERQHVFQ